MTEVPVVAAAPGIFRTALRLLPLQVLFRGGEAVFPLLLAAWLGRNAETDLYYLLAAYFVFAGGLLTAAFQDSGAVPVLIEVESTEPARLPTIAGSLLGHTIAAASLLGVAMGAIAGVLAWGFAEPRAIALQLTALMALGLVTTGVRAFFVGLLNARGLFHAHPVASGLGMGLTLIVLFLGRNALGVRIVPIALMGGELTAIVLLSGFSKRSLGLRIRPNLTRPEPVRRIFGLLRLEALGQLITRINPVLDQLMAGLAGVVGGGTLLRYAGDIASLPTSLIQATVLPVFLTRIAQEARRPSEFAPTLRRTLVMVIAMLMALSGLIMAFRLPVCRLLFLHGAMDEEGVARMAGILPWALLGVAPFGALLVLARAHVAQQNSRIMPSMGILNSALNAALNAVFVSFLGLAGIALSTSVTYAIVAIVFWVRLPKASRASYGET